MLILMCVLQTWRYHTYPGWEYVYWLRLASIYSRLTAFCGLQRVTEQLENATPQGSTDKDPGGSNETTRTDQCGHDGWCVSHTCEIILPVFIQKLWEFLTH